MNERDMFQTIFSMQDMLARDPIFSGKSNIVGPNKSSMKGT